VSGIELPVLQRLAVGWTSVAVFLITIEIIYY